MYEHAPAGYDCPFCRIIAGKDNPFPYTTQADVICRDAQTLAFMNARWWPHNIGPVLVIPTTHVENLFGVSPELAAHIHATAQRVGLAMMRAYGCDGISTRQHNGPGANQEVWHYHLHVFPRSVGDQLYALSSAHRVTTPDERLPYAERLRAAL